MIQNRLEPQKPADPPAAPKVVAPAGKPSRGNGWGLLFANLILMPALAYGVTVFVLIPKIEAGKSPDRPTGSIAAPNAPAKGRNTVPLGGKILVNVAGTSGTRYLVAQMTLVGKAANLKAGVEEADSQLRDAAMSLLSAKTISDLEKPGGRNLIRAELIAAFNQIMGKEAVTDIYFTEFAIQ